MIRRNSNFFPRGKIYLHSAVPFGCLKKQSLNADPVIYSFNEYIKWERKTFCSMNVVGLIEGILPIENSPDYRRNLEVIINETCGREKGGF